MSTSSSGLHKVPRGLLSSAALWGMGAVAVLGFAALLPFAYEREKQAALEEPSALSMTYLRIALREHPDDAALRLEVAQAALRMFAFDEARTTLSPLLGASGEHGRRARELSMDLEQRAWAAVPVDDPVGREQALERYRAALRAVRSSELSAAELDVLAQRTREVGLSALRAQLLSERARRGQPLTGAQLAGVEQALLEAGAPLSAARLRAQHAVRTRALDSALVALRHARSAAQPESAWMLFEELRRAFGDRVALLEVGITIASDRADTRAALLLAERLLALEPDRPERHAQVAQLATWLGYAKRALVAQLWLLEHDASDARFATAETTARALSDLRALRQVYERRPLRRLDRPGLLKRIAVYAALGEPQRAYALLTTALDAEHGSDRALWNLRFAMERADGQLERAADTLSAMDARFAPDAQRTEQRADLLLRIGRTSDAIEVLSAATPESDYGKLARLGQLAWQSSSVDVARRAYRDATQLRAAKESDFHRLYTLDVLQGDLGGALATAQRGLARFDSLPMLELSMSAALAAEDDGALSALFIRSEREGSPLQHAIDYVVLRVSYRQALANRVRKLGDFPNAELILAAAGTDLGRALAHYGTRTPLRLRQLATAQHAEELAVVLAQNDRAKLAALYEEVAPELPPRMHVYILHQLGRDERAIEVAARSLTDPALTAADRDALTKDANALAAGVPRYVDAQIELTDMGPLRLWQARASTLYAASGRTWSGGIDYTKLDVTDATFVDVPRTHQLSPWLGLRKLWREHDASMRIGVDLRDGVSPRPWASFGEVLRLGTHGSNVSLLAQLNEVPTDTAALRLLGVRDQLGGSVEVAFTERWFGSAGVSGTRYGTRDRDLLGGGLTAEASLGARLFAPDNPLFGNVRVASRVAPRWSVSSVDGAGAARALAAGWLVPDTTHWLGVGATLGRGTLAIPPVSGRTVRFVLDGSIGWLFPQDQLGYYGRAGLGMPLVGGDLLGLSARASNVLSTRPGSAAWSVQLEYALGLWR